VVEFSPNNRLLAYTRLDRTIVMARNPFWQPGDVNGDGCVNDSDLLSVLFAFGQTGTNLSEDINNDGVVNDADLLETLFQFGTGC